jgi:hypothetical protein
LTPEGGEHLASRKDKVEIGNFGLPLPAASFVMSRGKKRDQRRRFQNGEEKQRR